MWNGYGWNLKPTDAPSDGKIYGRRDATWAEVISDVTKAYVDAEVAKQVPRAGGITMTGHLGLPTGPSAQHAVRKDYVDAADALKLSLTGGTVTGTLNLSVPYGGMPLTLTETTSTYRKYFRVSGTGTLEIVNHANTVVIMTLSDGGVLSSSGAMNAAGMTALPRGFSPSNVDAASFLASSASYGGGLTLIDGAYRACMWAQSANLALATGGNPPAIKLLLQNDNNHQLTGGLSATGAIKVSHGGGAFYRERTPTHSVIHYTDADIHYFLLTNQYDPDGGWNSLRPFYFNVNTGNVNMGHRVDVGGHVYSAAGRLLGTNDGAFSNYLPTWGGTITGGLTVTSTLVTDANMWVKGGVVYLSGGGHYMNWQDGWFYDFPHGPIRLQGAWVVREGTNPTMSGLTSSGSVHAHSGHYYMNSDNGVWQRWRGDLGRSEFSHGIFVSTVHQHVGSYAAGYYQKGGVSGGFEGARFNIQNGGPAFHFWSEDTSYGAIYMGSDYRIKKDVKPLSSTWEKVKKLRPISFKLNGYGGFTEDGVERWGFIAHELQDTLIESVANGKKDVVNEIQAPWPMAVIAPIAKALQEAMERIEILEDLIYLHFKKEKEKQDG